jgi:hypothetical protein
MPTCPTCDKELNTSHGVKTHHSQVHGESIAGKEVSCHWCDSTFSIPPSVVSRYDRHFCKDKDCRAEWLSETNVGENHNNYSRVTIECEICSTEKTVPESRKDSAKFCSESCRTESISNEVTLFCDFCAGDYTKAKSREDVSSFCSESCKNASMRIERENTKCSSNWSTFSKKYRNWVGECECCGSIEQLHTHHDEPVFKGGDLWDNTFTVLCADCHLGDYDKWH